MRYMKVRPIEEWHRIVGHCNDEIVICQDYMIGMLKEILK